MQHSVITQNPDSDIVQLVQKMTLRQKIGQVMLVNFRYCRLSEAESNFSQATDFENFDGNKKLSHRQYNSLCRKYERHRERFKNDF